MTPRPTQFPATLVNLIAGIALLVMFCPHHGRVPPKPAGVRTAIELISKKPSLSTWLAASIAAE
jgi:hypothetical protein